MRTETKMMAEADSETEFRISAGIGNDPRRGLMLVLRLGLHPGLDL